MAARKEDAREAVLFGYDSADDEKTGFVRADNRGLRVVSDIEEATVYPADKAPDWCAFLREEPTLAGWRFHPVKIRGGFGRKSQRRS